MQPEPAGDAPVIVIRTNHIDATLRRTAERLGAESGYRVCFAADETGGAIDCAPFPKIALTRESIADLGVLVSADMLWRCGDYCLYAARRQYPTAPFFWLIEPDVEIGGASLRAFFARYETALPRDFIVGYFGPYAASWPWHRLMAPHAARVYGCLFALLRISGPAVDFLLERRQALTRHFAAGADAALWPNDESFTATELALGGFACGDLNDPPPAVYHPDSYRFGFPIARSRLDRKGAPRVYHPVMGGRQLAYRRLRLLARGLRHPGTMVNRVQPVLHETNEGLENDCDQR